MTGAGTTGRGGLGLFGGPVPEPGGRPLFGAFAGRGATFGLWVKLEEAGVPSAPGEEEWESESSLSSLL
jgi:hypothetical protein